MTVPVRPTRFFRIVESDPPTLWDFLSSARRGRQLKRPSPEVDRLFTGISVFETLEQARRQAQRYPRLGQFIAEIELPMAAQAECERTTRTEGHWTIWASPGLLLGCVIRVTSTDVVG